MADMYIGVAGVSRVVKTGYIGVAGVSRTAKAGYIGVNGVARQFLKIVKTIIYTGEVSPSDGRITVTCDGTPTLIKLSYTLRPTDYYILYDASVGTDRYERVRGSNIETIYFSKEGGYVQEGGFRFWWGYPSTYEYTTAPIIVNSGEVSSAGNVVEMTCEGTPYFIKITSKSDSSKYIKYERLKTGEDCYERWDGTKYFSDEGGYVREGGFKFYINWGETADNTYVIRSI